MSLRMPQHLSNSARFETGHSAFEAELAAEKAANLGRIGKQVEQALGALQAGGGGDQLVIAAEAVWRLFVQRECCGILDHQQVVVDYRIPRCVLARLGAM